MEILLVFVFLFFASMLIYAGWLLHRIMKELPVTSRLHKCLILALLPLCFLLLHAFHISGIAILFLLHFLILSVATDLIYFLVKRHVSGAFFQKLYRRLIIPLLLCVGLFVYGWFNIHNIIQTDYTLYTEKDIDGSVRILFISDSHYGSVIDQKKLDSMKEKLDRTDADIVILGGDIIDEDTSKEEMEYIFKTFGSIQNTQGVYFVYGNHDRQLYSTERAYSEAELASALALNNITALQDSYITLPNNILIAGREDYSPERKALETFLPPFSSDHYVIMADHQPVQYEENAAHDVDLILSGHTHAGQLFPAEIIINLFHTADLAYGHRNLDGMDAIVSSGFGGWNWPIRTARHSEYVVIDIIEK